jgi:8-oxo-dGTP pyrophosphatase MutT (NUDIX family)
MGARAFPGRARRRDEALLWLTLAGERRGRIVPGVAAALRSMPALFVRRPDGFALRDEGLSREARSERLQEAAHRLRALGLVPGWRDELCELLGSDGIEIARLERGAFRTLGLQNRAVHVNGVHPDGRLWIARRSAHKLSSPNKLDNFAAGAIVAGESPLQCAVRELWEEAGVPADIAAGLVFPGRAIRSLRPIAWGMHDEVLICADLELPDDFVPVCQDGEVAQFLCMTPGEAQGAIERGEFSVEAALVVSDWLARRPG